MSLSLVGIIGLQFNQIRKAIRLSQKNFDASVNDALNEVVDQLQTAEVQTKLIKVSRELKISDAEEDSIGKVVLDVEGDKSWPPTNQKRVRIRDSVAIVTEQETILQADSGMIESGTQSIVFYTEEPTTIGDKAIEMRGDPRMVEIFSTALQGINTFDLSIEDRIDSTQVDSLLRASLENQGIFQPHQFQVESGADNRIIFRTAISDFQSPQHRVQLFPYLGLANKSYLHVAFPDENVHALKSVWIEALAALLFSSIMLICFALTIRTIYQQKQLSEMKNDFINNMTHELKTPIATISLAADAMNNDKIISSPDGIRRYTGIIKEENLRMNRQVERVLQAARFDREEIELRRDEVDIHDLAIKAANNIRLQVEKRDGQLVMDLQAESFLLQADRVHMSNIIYNLLDNANKYSPETPNIKLSTKNEGKQLIIRVEDKGIGINKADQNQIFTRFFRVSTGNLHDVKGFGLGLSYVKEIVEAHAGVVSVKSQPGKGSIFEVRLPIH